MKYEYICTNKDCSGYTNKNDSRDKWKIMEKEFSTVLESRHVMCDFCSSKLVKVPSIIYKKKVICPKHTGVKNV